MNKIRITENKDKNVELMQLSYLRKIYEKADKFLTIGKIKNFVVSSLSFFAFVNIISFLIFGGIPLFALLIYTATSLIFGLAGIYFINPSKLEKPFFLEAIVGKILSEKNYEIINNYSLRKQKKINEKLSDVFNINPDEAMIKMFISDIKEFEDYFSAKQKILYNIVCDHNVYYNKLEDLTNYSIVLNDKVIDINNAHELEDIVMKKEDITLEENTNEIEEKKSENKIVEPIAFYDEEVIPYIKIKRK